MNDRGTFAVLLLLATTLAGACGSDDDDRPPPAGNLGGRGGSTGSGARSGSSQGGSGDASSSGGEGGGELGPGGQTGGEACGDGVQGGAEECDGDDFDGLGCPDFGYDEGDLVCSGGCLIEIDQCSGVEQCADGRDNDGDGSADCQDDECQDACAEPCSAPGELGDPAELTALTIGRSDALGSECSMVAGEPGPDAVYGFVAANSGTLEIELEATTYMVVSVHGSCGSSTAMACTGDYLSLPITAGDELTLAVESPTPDDAGQFTLRVFSRENQVCGDGYRDEGESCDDGDQLPDDGCDDSCAVESLETESNDTTAEADAYFDGFYAEISPAADVDVVAVEIGGSPGSLVVEVRGIGTDCERLRTDSFVEVLDPLGVVIDPGGSDDDGGDGLCSRLVVSGLAAGTHYVRVSAAGETPTFPYVLDVTRNWCGDGLLGPGEQCDEGDTADGDGCSALCQNE